MMKNNIYIDYYLAQECKHKHNVCGDYAIIHRCVSHTDFVLCDGLGSGIKANISAIAHASRIKELLSQELSITRTSEKIVALLKRARTENVPYSTFTIIRINSNGEYTLINYENPTPLIITNSIIQEVKVDNLSSNGEIIQIANGVINIGDSFIATSDGVSQAGLGLLPNLGWGNKGLINHFKYNKGKELTHIADTVLDKTYSLSNNMHRDDTTVCVLTAREARELDIISGPSLSYNDNERFVKRFLSAKGKKAVCGSSTSEMVAKVMGKELKITKMPSSYTQPPSYSIEGIDIVTEGAITLNQLNNIIEENPDTYETESCVSKLAKMVLQSDIINLHIGRAMNKGHINITFKQMGVLPRHRILPILAEKLEKMGKLVTLKYM